MRKLFLLLLSVTSGIAFSQKIPTKFEQSNGTQTPTYYEIIDWWKGLDAASPLVKMQEMGPIGCRFSLAFDFSFHR